MNRNRVVVEFIHPPIPDRSFDYCAYLDGREGGPAGYSDTEAGAIEALHDELDACNECQKPIDPANRSIDPHRDCHACNPN